MPCGAVPKISPCLRRRPQSSSAPAVRRSEFLPICCAVMKILPLLRCRDGFSRDCGAVINICPRLRCGDLPLPVPASRRSIHHNLSRLSTSAALASGFFRVCGAKIKISQRLRRRHQNFSASAARRSNFFRVCGAEI